MLNPTMLKKIFLSAIAPVLLVGTFSIFVFGQATPFNGKESDTEIFVRMVGWIMLSGAALTHITSNIYAVVKGKSYDQLKESVANYKELAGSRMDRLSDALARIAILELELPVIDGLRLAKEIRKNEERHPEKRPTKLVFYTGQEIDGTIERVGEKVGVEKRYMIHKPYSPNDLVHELKHDFGEV